MTTDNWLLLAAVLGIPMLLFTAAFVVGCFERHPVRQFRWQDLPSLPPYMSAALQQAAAHGFTWIASGVHTKFGDKLPGILLISPDRLIVATIGEGTILGMPAKKTFLYSRMRSGQILACTDEVGTAEMDPGSTRKHLMNAGFAELLAAQEKLIQQTASVPEPFSPEPGWAAIDALYEFRADRMVQAGVARYHDVDRQFIRYRPWASFRMTIVHGLLQSFQPQNLWRHVTKGGRR